MKKTFRLHFLLGLIIFLFALTACGQSDEMAVTFTDKECTYTGPTSIPSSRVSVSWTITDTSHTGFYLGFIQLTEGKTAADLAAFREGEDDSWIRIISLHPATGAGTQVVETDLSANGAFQYGPIYIACVNDPDIGPFDAIGPLEIQAPK